MFAQATLPPPDAIRKTAAEVVARPYFELGGVRHQEGPSLFLEILRWILRPILALFDGLSGLPAFIQWLVVIVCILLVVAIVAHIVFTLINVLGGPITARRERQFVLSARDANPDDLEQQAEASGGRGDYIDAIRLLFRAALRRIELAEERKLRPGLTNRELLRRYQTSPFRVPLERLVEMIELKWYGSAPCELADYQVCQAEHAHIRESVRNHAIAHNS